MNIIARNSILLAAGLTFIPGKDALADPPPQPGLAEVFCIRITDIEADGGDPEGNKYSFTFEILNWTDTPAAGLYLAQADPVAGNPGGLPGSPFISGTSIKPGGRGPLGSEPSSENPDGLGGGGFGVHHSGRGRTDLPGLLNDWSAGPGTTTSATYDGTAGTSVPNRDLIGAFNSGGLPAAQALVPGFGFDNLFDSAVDGGPGPYTLGFPGEAGPPVPEGSGNVLDGLVIEVDDLDLGEVVSFNWFLTDNLGNPLGTAGGGNAFGFGNFILGPSFFDAEFSEAEFGDIIFDGNSGLNQDEPFFVFDALLNTGFGVVGEVGGGITAPFMNPADNIFGAPVNTFAIPEPSRAMLLVLGALGALGRRRR